MNNLSEYNKKRNFKKTKEPKGNKEKSVKKLKFVVQHHLARRDHFDLRLEWEGTMKSWAVPKGPSYNTEDKRLAVRVEDHPLDYRNFEGIIPKGEYGGGTVMIWDEGYWCPTINPDFNKSIKFELYGSRLKGKWALVFFKEDNWLLIKEKDKYNEFKNIKRIKTSIRTGKTMEEIEGIKTKTNIEITNPNKVIFKKPKITKGMIAKYYEKVGIRMLPYIENRIISVVRSPEGMEKGSFFKKHLENINDNLGIKKISNEEGNKEDYYYIKDLNGLISEVQMNSFEFHTWGSTIKSLEKPDIMIFDLDPDEKLNLNKVREGVKDLKKILDELSIKSFLKTSGGKGYHIVAKVKSKSWKEHRDIAKNIAVLMEKKWPEKYTSNIRKDARKGKIYIDWVRNTRSSTSVAPYSVRMKKGAAISMPIKWTELDKIKPDEIHIEDAIKRLKRKDHGKDFLIIKTS